MTDIAGELHANGIWQPIELELALKMPKTRRIRCPECHGRVRAHTAGKNGMKAHMEHLERNPGCPRGDCFDGTPRRHPKALV
jgi:hypothetical protein